MSIRVFDPTAEDTSSDNPRGSPADISRRPGQLSAG